MEITENARGKQVKRRTITTINQMWFASHTGAMASEMSSRWRRARGPEARRSQTPPPKSAPPRMA